MFIETDTQAPATHFDRAWGRSLTCRSTESPTPCAARARARARDLSHAAPGVGQVSDLPVHGVSDSVRGQSKRSAPRCSPKKAVSVHRTRPPVAGGLDQRTAKPSEGCSSGRRSFDLAFVIAGSFLPLQIGLPPFPILRFVVLLTHNNALYFTNALRLFNTL